VTGAEITAADLVVALRHMRQLGFEHEALQTLDCRHCAIVVAVLGPYDAELLRKSYETTGRAHD
jgi:hypothetical protein